MTAKSPLCSLTCSLYCLGKAHRIRRNSSPSTTACIFHNGADAAEDCVVRQVPLIESEMRESGSADSLFKVGTISNIAADRQ
jgi:hypothetical protein